MTTSSDNKTPSTMRPEAKHWHELSCQLMPAETEKFAHWVDTQLRGLELAQKRFITNRSLVKSLRRS